MNTLENFVSDVKLDLIWSSDEFFDGESQYRYILWDHLNTPKYRPIIENLILETPPIGTPNAHTGEFELMLILTCHKTVTKPTKNDIFHKKYRTKNIKVGEPRLYTDVIGTELNKIMLEKFEHFGIEPYQEKGVNYAQLITESSVKHFNQQVKRLGLNSIQVTDILKTWLSQQFPKMSFADEYFNDKLVGVIVNGEIDLKVWEEVNLIHIFINSSNKFENFMIFGERGEIFHLTQNLENFKSLLNDGIIKYQGQFFRLNQPLKCAVYIKVVE